ncbi:hypothetical protein VTI74DRAFT_11295 [Chaetomium olivicolor]
MQFCLGNLLVVLLSSTRPDPRVLDSAWCRQYGLKNIPVPPHDTHTLWHAVTALALALANSCAATLTPTLASGLPGRKSACGQPAGKGTPLPSPPRTSNDLRGAGDTVEILRQSNGLSVDDGEVETGREGEETGPDSMKTVSDRQTSCLAAESLRLIMLFTLAHSFFEHGTSMMLRDCGLPHIRRFPRFWDFILVRSDRQGLCSTSRLVKSSSAWKGRSVLPAAVLFQTLT